jgi:hypothetical protein
VTDKRRHALAIQEATGWPYTKALQEADRLWAAYQVELPKAEAEWKASIDPYGGTTLPPPEIMVIAKIMELDVEDLWDHVEGAHGWEPHDTGYEEAVWAAARCTDSHV